ncbi:hypothetical protein Taro_038397 [Colocasia esculenta]|uniref:Uncharacterized protein n=1 Tax=Colocasia esculenta TaxID=4460 RepID=A0A843WM43_COLES|nr:hypothetical protein [Colocasia esculenta]
MPVVTSRVGYPRFSVSQARSARGLVPALIWRLCGSSGNLHRLGDTLNIGEASPTPVCDLHRHKDRIWEDLEHLLGLSEEGQEANLLVQIPVRFC